MSVSFPSGLGAKGNEGVAGQVSSTPGAVGYVELVYAAQNKLPYAAVRNAAGAFVMPTPSAITAAGAGALAGMPDDLRATLADSRSADAYPIAGYTYVLLYASAIVFFCFFYTALVFNSKETAENLKKSGAFVPGIRPGEQTSRYIDKILMRLTLAGAIYVTLVCLMPEFLQSRFNVPFYFGGTSLLIVVSVTMDTVAQIQGYLLAHQYEGLIKRSKLRGRKR